jgi:DNA-binding transcriptional regulator YhcF (GntR family)
MHDDALVAQVIDVASAIPRYVQLASHLREQIIAGVLPAGAAVPSEAHLQAAYGVNRQTARSAVAMLRQAGWVVTHRARATIVLPPGPPKMIEALPGSVIRARLPTLAEREAHNVADAVPVLVITQPGGGEVIADSSRAVIVITGGS